MVLYHNYQLSFNLDHRSKFKPSLLSGGEQQRVCIARAIVKNPELILADEPTGNLDPAAAHKILKILEQINKEGTTVIMATHDLRSSAQFEQIIVLEKGIVVGLGAHDELLKTSTLYQELWAMEQKLTDT